jgi:hypothetical protein
VVLSSSTCGVAVVDAWDGFWGLHGVGGGPCACCAVQIGGGVRENGVLVGLLGCAELPAPTQ